jgi:hypothetical protein
MIYVQSDVPKNSAAEWTARSLLRLTINILTRLYEEKQLTIDDTTAMTKNVTTSCDVALCSSYQVTNFKS